MEHALAIATATAFCLVRILVFLGIPRVRVLVELTGSFIALNLIIPFTTITKFS